MLHALRYGGAGSQGRAELENWLERLQPGWRDHVVHASYLPKLQVSCDAVRADGGGLPGRPGPCVPDVPGLWVAGDWVGARGMLADAALASAAEVAAQVARDIGRVAA